MKTKFLSFSLFFALCGGSAMAQTQLWGTCTAGGISGAGDGTIFTANGDGTGLHKVYDFVNASGAWPLGSMTLANNGVFYGVTEFGGFGDSCVNFKYDPIITGVYTNIHDFYQFQNLGWAALSGLLNASDGKLYGLCKIGGLNNKGVIYSINPATDIYTDIYDFNGADGSDPMGSLMQANDGNLYGLTSDGGIYVEGVIFRFNIFTNTYTKLYDLGSSGGSPARCRLIQATNGKLYGTATWASGGAGGIFSFDILTNVFTDLYNFSSSIGGATVTGVIQASDGKLYGIARDGFAATGGYGFLYSFDINTNVFTDLFDFNSTNGAKPQRELIQATDGKLYGTTYSGGIYNKGVVFSYDIATSTYTKLIDFDGTSLGANPDCEIIETPAFSTVGISAITNPKSEMVRIFPNPATTSITITSPERDETITITDVLGRELTSVKLFPNGKSTLDITTYPSIFFVKTKEGVQKVVH